MSGQWVFIQPQDVWMFRDSKPFSAQQNFVARSQFPPNPQTMQGVIRSHYLQSMGVDWKAYVNGHERSELYDAVGHAQIGDTPPTLGNLRITGPLMGVENKDGKVECLIPAPLDLLRNGEGKIAPLKPSDKFNFHTALPFKGWQPLYAPEVPEDPNLTDEENARKRYSPIEDGWLTQQQFMDYLSGKLKTGDLRKTKTVFEYEDRIGLGMDHGRRAHEQSLLYRAHFVRPCDDVGMLLHINQPLFAEQGFMRIGGESRSAKFRVVNNFALPLDAQGGRFKIVLLTPAYFSEGWHPTDRQDWTRWVTGGRLVSAVIGKPLSISGWDIARNQSKPLRHFVPAGSVYYFEGGQITGQSFTETPHGEADFGATGFGSFAVGVW